MKLQRLLSLIRQAVDNYNMIEEGDRIAVGISGGKDSLTLLYALANLRRFYPKPFELEAVSVNLGFDTMDYSKVKDLCSFLGVNLTVVRTEIYDIIFNQRKESNPCSLCAKMRKGALNQAVLDLHCNKIAYAHHKDDFIETLFMSMLYEGQLYCFPPVTHFEDTGLSVIRPMMYVNEADVSGFKNANKLPVMANPCPADGNTKREYVKQLIRRINRENPGVKNRLFHAVITGNFSDWPVISPKDKQG